MMELSVKPCMHENLCTSNEQHNDKWNRLFMQHIASSKLHGSGILESVAHRTEVQCAISNKMSEQRCISVTSRPILAQWSRAPIERITEFSCTSEEKNLTQDLQKYSTSLCTTNHIALHCVPQVSLQFWYRVAAIMPSTLYIRCQRPRVNGVWLCKRQLEQQWPLSHCMDLRAYRVSALKWCQRKMTLRSRYAVC